MKIAVWGAGNLGTPLVYRLCSSSQVSGIAWINRSLSKIEKRAIDARHGLSMAPTCRDVRAVGQRRAAKALQRVELLVVTLGVPVPPGRTRADLYDINRGLFRQSVLPVLAGFEGIVLVVTNPVDLMARLIYREAKLESRRVLGLGTVVETSRLKTALARRLWPHPHPGDVDAIAVGTHDQHFLPRLSKALQERLSAGAREAARHEVVKGAARVRQLDPARSSIHPIVEGSVAVVEAIASDARRQHTVSTLDPEDADELFWSVPCHLDRSGVAHREDLHRADVQAGLRELRSVLAAHPD